MSRAPLPQQHQGHSNILPFFCTRPHAAAEWSEGSWRCCPCSESACVGCLSGAAGVVSGTWSHPRPAAAESASPALSVFPEEEETWKMLCVQRVRESTKWVSVQANKYPKCSECFHLFQHIWPLLRPLSLDHLHHNPRKGIFNVTLLLQDGICSLWGKKTP